LCCVCHNFRPCPLGQLCQPVIRLPLHSNSIRQTLSTHFSHVISPTHNACGNRRKISNLSKSPQKSPRNLSNLAKSFKTLISHTHIYTHTRLHVSELFVGRQENETLRINTCKVLFIHDL